MTPSTGVRAMKADAALGRHNSELARAGAAAMQRHYQETIDICSDLLTADVYEAMEQHDAKLAKAARAETRLILATAMHYNESHYEDIIRVLGAALDSPTAVQKDVYFTLAVIHASFDREDAARAAMERCLGILQSLRKAAKTEDLPAFDEKEREARQFLKQLGHAPAG